MSPNCTRRHMATIQASLLMMMVFVFAGGASASTTLTFQDGVSDGGAYAGTQDTFIQPGGSATTNFNSFVIPVLIVYETNDPSNLSRTLIKFDLSSIAPGTAIGSADLTLTYAGYNGFGATGVTNSLYVINNTTSPADVNWTESTATWNDATTSQAWNGGPGLVSGVDYGAAAVATVNTPNAGATTSGQDNGATMTFTLDTAGLAAINDWINNPSDNTGFFIRQPDGTGSVDFFYSSEATPATLHPELTLVTTPEPASLGLLLVGGATLLRRRRGHR